jgi:2-polyprenyl-3-methyl-5-hydroxy-6-metoxy-1,4-benzoquinol methylase
MNAAESDYYDGLNMKLLHAIPSGACRVLELGCANGRLGQKFKSMHPAAQWWGVDMSPQAVAAASQHLDRVFQLDLDSADLSILEGGFDVIVLGDLLEHMRKPEALLDALHQLAATGAQIVCCLPNMGHLSVIERLVVGDISYDGAGLLDRTHLHFFSPSSAFKLFLDSGWVPHMQDEYRVEVQKTPFAERIVGAALALGVPIETTLRNMGCYQMILVCTKWPKQPPAQEPCAPFSVIVPVNKSWQYGLNVARSPGLQEVGAEIICIEGAESAAAAFAAGAAKASHAWRVMAHQDVYFPAGSGFALAQQLHSLDLSRRLDMPVGFAGLELDPVRPGQARHAGMVVDRRSLFLHGTSDRAISMDELAVCLHRETPLAIDPALGWHLWATDLCLQAEHRADQPVARLLGVPLFHNSVTTHSLPDAFHASANYLMAKYPGRTQIPTLCGNLVRQTA